MSESERPTVFISYSHDSEDHKKWVADLAARLRKDDGVDAVLDGWNLRGRQRCSNFMNTGIVGNDRVLCVCTDEYNKKVNEGRGGAGYEGQIISDEMVRNSSTDKFIPIIRGVTSERKVPLCLSDRSYIDFTDDSLFEEKYQELVQEVFRVDLAPPLGPSRYPYPHETKNQSTSSRSLTAPSTPQDYYPIASEIISRQDFIAWHDLYNSLQIQIPKVLRDWQEGRSQTPPATDDRWIEAVDEVVNAFAPIFIVALVAVKSRKSDFVDQSSLLRQLEVSTWQPGSLQSDRISGISETCLYVFHSLHGAMCLSTGQLDTALSFLEKPQDNPLWSRGGVIGCPNTLWTYESSWRYLAEAPQRFTWLSPLFHSPQEFLECLIAYYMGLNVFELAYRLAEGMPDDKWLNRLPKITAPVSFSIHPPAQTNPALRRLRETSGFATLHERVGISLGQIELHWQPWMDYCEQWYETQFRRYLINGLPLKALFETFLSGK